MKMKKVTAFMMTAALAASVLSGCGSGSEKQVVIYSNADDEAVEAMNCLLYTSICSAFSKPGGKVQKPLCGTVTGERRGSRSSYNNRSHTGGFKACQPVRGYRNCRTEYR